VEAAIADAVSTESKIILIILHFLCSPVNLSNNVSTPARFANNVDFFEELPPATHNPAAGDLGTPSAE
jgi:hypothetical protein